MLDSLLSLIAPFECLGCGNEGDLLCPACYMDAYEPLAPRCYRCQKSSQQFVTCATCRHESPLLQVFPAYSFTDAHIKEIIYHCKFKHARADARLIARMMQLQLPDLGNGCMVVPVPTATARVRQRGFDHASLIAKNYAQLAHLPFAQVLLRLGQTRQVGANKKARHEQLLGAFRVTSPNLIKGEHIILIDDVLTTGATLEAAARVLRLHGARTVSALVFAQKFTR